MCGNGKETQACLRLAAHVSRDPRSPVLESHGAVVVIDSASVLVRPNRDQLLWWSSLRRSAAPAERVP